MLAIVCSGKPSGWFIRSVSFKGLLKKLEVSKVKCGLHSQAKSSDRRSGFDSEAESYFGKVTADWSVQHCTSAFSPRSFSKPPKVTSL